MPALPTDLVASFPVTVRVARSNEDRARVFALRARARGDADASRAADAWDRLPNATLLLAESKFDGEALGTLRILSGQCGPLMIDGLLELPAWLNRQSTAEGSRLVVCEGRDAGHVRLMLWKAFHRYCLAAQVQTMLVAARESAAHDYEGLGFTDVLPGAARFAPRGSAVATHRLLRLGVFEAHESMRRSAHPLRDFFFVERHPEIDLLGPVAGPAQRPKLPSRVRIAAELAEVAVV